MSVSRPITLAVGQVFTCRPYRLTSSLSLTTGLPMLGLLALLGHASSTRAHVIDVTEAAHATTVVEIFIGESEIRVELETGVPDLVAFQNVFPDEFRVRMGLESEALEPRLRRFFSEGFVIRADDGPPLPGRVVSFETRRRVPLDEAAVGPAPAAGTDGPPVVFVVFDYRLEGRPATLSFKPPSTDGETPAADIGFAAHHLGLPVTELRPLGADEILDLDWEDPGFSSFRNRDPGRLRESPMKVFLHVEPFEVRVEVVVRPVDVQASTDVGVGRLSTIPVENQEDVAQRVAGVVAGSFDLVIDGETSRPGLDRVDFVNRTLRSAAVSDPPRELDVRAATLGVVFRKTMPGYPGEVAMTWRLFSDRVDRVTGAITDEAGPLQGLLHGGDNVLCWTNVLDDPTLQGIVAIEPPPSPFEKGVMWACWLGLAMTSVLLIRGGARAAGGGGTWSHVLVVALVVAGFGGGAWFATRTVRVSEDRAGEIVSGLLHNVYRALNGRDQDAVSDALEQSLIADLPTEVFSEPRDRLGFAGRGGARTRVVTVDVAEVSAQDAGPGFTARCAWNVVVSAGHWGHVHRQNHRFVADLLVEPVDGRWKIAGFEMRP